MTDLPAWAPLTGARVAAAVCQGEDDYLEVVSDPAFLQSVLESLPGVDPQSEDVRRAMGSIAGSGSGAKNPPEDDKKDDDKSKKK